jgi:hypothetical protein
LFTLIAPNKNGQLFYKNLDVMIKVISPQLPKYITKAIASIEIRPIPHLEMGREVADKLREPPNIPKNMALIISQICQ